MLKFISVTLMSQLRNGGSRTHTQIHSHARSNTMLLLVAVFGSHFKLSWMELPNIPLGTGPSNCQQLVTSLVLSLYHFVFHEFWPLPLIFLKKINLFIYLWLHWVFVAAHRLSLVVASGGSSLLRCAGFSSCGMRAQ